MRRSRSRIFGDAKLETENPEEVMLETVLSGVAMQKLDAEAIASGISSLILMENAARGATDVLWQEFGPPRSAWVICGKGNNGGDGLAMARHLHNRGVATEVLVLGDPESLTQDAGRNLMMARATGVSVTFAATSSAVEGWLQRTPPDVLVDAILGTGLNSAARGVAATAIEAILERPEVPVLALDLPSGLSADTGRIPGPAVRARVTAALCRPKVPHYLYPAAELCGRVRVVDISIPRSQIEATIPAYRIGAPPLDWLPPRTADTHKGSYGRVLIVAGSPGMTGAAALAARAAVRGGAGLVTVAIGKSSEAVLAAKLMEAMSLRLPEAADGGLDPGGADLVLQRLQDTKATLLLGPGLGQAASTAEFARRLIRQTPGPLVLDADGLNALGTEAGRWLEARSTAALLTPHPGEMSRLLGHKLEDRLQEARDFARATRSILVLKGAGTVVSDGLESYVNGTGNPGMATGGSGDVLGGLLAALSAQGLPPWWAAVLGVYLHGLAGDLAAEALSQEALGAADLVEALPRAWRRWRGQGG